MCVQWFPVIIIILVVVVAVQNEKESESSRAEQPISTAAYCYIYYVCLWLCVCVCIRVSFGLRTASVCVCVSVYASCLWSIACAWEQYCKCIPMYYDFHTKHIIRREKTFLESSLTFSDFFSQSLCIQSALQRNFCDKIGKDEILRIWNFPRENV